MKSLVTAITMQAVNNVGKAGSPDAGPKIKGPLAQFLKDYKKKVPGEKPVLLVRQNSISGATPKVAPDVKPKGPVNLLGLFQANLAKQLGPPSKVNDIPGVNPPEAPKKPLNPLAALLSKTQPVKAGPAVNPWAAISNAPSADEEKPNNLARDAI
jgi:hypothetical protein